MSELTLRGLLLGIALTFVFTAANVYLGLRSALTFATSIPAAVISMAVLRMFASRSIRENNIVQIVASAAGALASIIFVLPGLVMIGMWTSFPYWETFAICAFGGILGVMFSIPLRRALVVNSPLPYPEGVAAAEVLKVGTAEGADAENKRGLLVVAIGTLASAGFAAFVAMRGAAAEVARFFYVGGGAATGASFGFQLALVGAGHLIGLSVGLAMLAGLIIAWGFATPFLTSMAPLAETAQAAVGAQFGPNVRFIGAGAIAVAAVWALFKLIGPIFGGLFNTMQERGAASATKARTDQDIPTPYILLITLACFVPIVQVLHGFVTGQTALSNLTTELLIAGVLFVIIGGFFVSCVCGYMAGLIGSSNSPISGVGILGILTFAYLLSLFALPQLAEGVDPKPLVAFALIVLAVAFAAAAISNDNLQDLKTGHLVGGTPWRQQVALIVGVVAGAIVIPPILDLLNAAYGFTPLDGSVATASTTGAQPLPAPQATLISNLAMGVIGGEANWAMLGAGAILGLGLIFVDEALGFFKLIRLPPLAIGIGIYLPMATTAPVIVGALLGRFYDGRMNKNADPAAGKRLGVLLASGLIVGESLFNVALAGIIVASSSASPLKVFPDSFEETALWVGAGLFVALLFGLYNWIGRMAKRPV